MARLSRVDDPLDERWWTPGEDAVRVDFSTTRLMVQAGIQPDMSDEADDGYLALVRRLADEIDGDLDLRSTGYRYGPASGDADPAFLDFIRTGLTLLEAGGVLAMIVDWLHRMGATEVRISDSAAESLAFWEVSRAGHGTPTETVSVSRGPTQTSPTGRRQAGQFVVVLRLESGQLATLRLGPDGMLHEIAVGTSH